MSDPNPSAIPDQPASPSPRDPRLEIPEVLRTPIKKPDLAAAQSLGKKTDTLANAGNAWAIAFNFLATIIALGLLGWTVQQWLVPKWAPWPLLTGLGLGLVGGFWRFVREAMKANK